MSDIICSYSGDREAMLMAFVYDDIAPAERGEFEAHLATCARCRVEVNGFHSVRAQLARWSPPAFQSNRQSVTVGQTVVVNPSIAAPVAKPSFAWREVPAWAQAVAAVLVLGVAAGMANVDVHYDSTNGLNIHTGWSRRVDASNRAANEAAAPAVANVASQQDLVALEEKLRSEIRAAQAVQHSTAAPNDADMVRRIKALIEQSERGQQREVALRLAEVMHEVDQKRNSDLRKIDTMLDQTGVEVLRTRGQMDYLLQRVSQRQ